MATTSDFLNGGKGPAKLHYLSDINVTPFVDVMLVLLVIFMITAPMMATGVKVDLPQAHTRQLAADMKPVEVAIDADGQIFVNESPVAADDFALALHAIAEDSGDPAQMRVFVSADRSIDYGAVMAVVSQIANAGFTRVAFLSDSRKRAIEQATP
jgi:biopolymer transport protein TolR